MAHEKIMHRNTLFNNFESFACYCLILCDKNPGVPPTFVSEILRWIAGKVVIAATRNDVITSVGALQVCAEHGAGCEALVHLTSLLCNEKKDVVLLLDVENEQG